MKKMLKLLGIAAIFAALLGVVGCDDGSGGGGSAIPDVIKPNTEIPEPDFGGEGNYFPAKDATGVYEDDSLLIKFDAVPVINRNSGKTVKLYEVATDGTVGTTEIATVKPKDEKIKTEAGDINVKNELITLNGKVVTIKLPPKDSKNSILENNKTYAVVIEDGLISGKIGGADFKGVSSGAWKFTTREAPSVSGSTINVGKDKDFSTLQGAFNYMMNNTSVTDWTINVDSGFYHECLVYKGNANAKIVGATGEGAERPHFYWNNSQYIGNSQRTRQSFLWQGKNLTLENLSFENTASRAGDADGQSVDIQAETLYFDCNSDLVVYNSKFYSYQDTLLIGTSNSDNYGGHAWFYKCEVGGDVDFIWGYSTATLFEDCTIVCRNDGIKKTAEIFASRTVAKIDKVGKGFVLLNCQIVVEDGCDAYYGRTSNGGDSQATVLNCTVDGTINSKLWNSKGEILDYDINGDAAIAFKSYNNKKGDTVISTAGKLAGTEDLCERVAKREYNGRWVILNRIFDKTTKAYEKAESIWDINAIATGYNASTDASVNNIYIEPVAVKKFVSGSRDLTFTCVGNDGNAVADVVWAATEEKTTGDTTIIKEAVSAGVLKTNEATGGTVTVKATKGDVSDIAYVYAIPTYIPVETVKIENADTTIPLHSTPSIAATVEAAEGKEPSDLAVVWSTSNKDVIQFVGSDGKKTETVNSTSGKSINLYVVGKGSATITATAVDEGSTVSPKPSKDVELTVSEYVTEWTPMGAGVAVNTDVQKGAWADFNGMLVDSETYNNRSDQAGKMAMKTGNVTMQTRNVILYIPIDRDATIKFELSEAPGANAGITTDGVNLEGSTYTYSVTYANATPKSEIVTTKVVRSAKKYAKVEFNYKDVKITKITRTYAEGTSPDPEESVVTDRTWTFIDDAGNVDATSEEKELFGGKATLKSGKLTANSNSGCCIASSSTVIQMNEVGEVKLSWYNGGTDDYGRDGDAKIVYMDGKATITFGDRKNQFYVKQLSIDYTKTPADSTLYNVTFNYNYDGAPTAIVKEVVDGGKVQKPADPTRTGFDFVGWFTAETGGEEFDVANTVINATLNLYAHWAEITDLTVNEDTKFEFVSSGDAWNNSVSAGEVKKVASKLVVDGTGLASDKTFSYNGSSWYSTWQGLKFELTLKVGTEVSMSLYYGQKLSVSVGGGTATPIPADKYTGTTGSSVTLTYLAENDGIYTFTFTDADYIKWVDVNVNAVVPAPNVSKSTNFRCNTAEYVVAAGKEKCVDCMLIEGNTGSFAQNGDWYKLLGDATITINLKSGTSITVNTYSAGELVMKVDDTDVTPEDAGYKGATIGDGTHSYTYTATAECTLVMSMASGKSQCFIGYVDVVVPTN